MNRIIKIIDKGEEVQIMTHSDDSANLIKLLYDIGFIDDYEFMNFLDTDNY